MVKKGDALYALDMSKLKTDIENEREMAALQQAGSSVTTQAAKRILEETKESSKRQIANANQAVADATADVNKAVNQRDSVGKTVNTLAANTANIKKDMEQAQTNMLTLEKNYNSLREAYNQAKNEVSSAERTLNAMKEQTPTLEAVSVSENRIEEPTVNQIDAGELEKAQLAYSNAVIKLNAAEAALTPVQTQYETAKGVYEAKKDGYEGAVSAEKAARSEQASIDAAVENANRQLAAANSASASKKASATASIAGQEDSIKTAQYSAKSSGLSAKNQIEKSEKIIEQETVYATMDGMVTHINVKADQIYSGTDATEEELLKGKVVFVSPIPTKVTGEGTSKNTAVAVSKSRASYRVDIQLETGNENLRLGMTAKMNIILESKENCLVVPGSAVLKAEDGSKYVSVVAEDGTAKHIIVETGMETDYYTEIKGGNIAEGDRLLADESSFQNAEAAVNEMGALGGIVD